MLTSDIIPVRRILLVDDSDFDREVIKRALQADKAVSYEFQELTTSDRLEETIEIWKPHLVILDHKLPDSNGVDILREIGSKKINISVPIIMATGNAVLQTAVDAMRLGASDYLVKSHLTSSYIHEIVERSLARAELQRAFSEQQILLEENRQRLDTALHTAEMVNEALLERERRLEQLAKSRDDFLSIASHELRTPLTSLKLRTQLYARRLKRDPAGMVAREGVETLVQQTCHSIDRLARLVDDMLDMTRIRTGKLTIDREPTDFCALIRSVVSTLQPAMEEAGTPPHLSHEGAIACICDRFRIEQVITNLLTNAMRYGNGQPVDISVQERSGNAIFVVRDHGIGILPEDCDRIFERFERVGPSKKIRGLGLGLFISRQIVEAHEGAVYARSNGVGEGTTFTVTLPLTPTS